jgi:hypothetical protein
MIISGALCCGLVLGGVLRHDARGRTFNAFCPRHGTRFGFGEAAE